MIGLWIIGIIIFVAAVPTLISLRIEENRKEREWRNEVAKRQRLAREAERAEAEAEAKAERERTRPQRLQEAQEKLDKTERLWDEWMARVGGALTLRIDELKAKRRVDLTISEEEELPAAETRLGNNTVNYRMRVEKCEKLIKEIQQEDLPY